MVEHACGGKRDSEEWDLDGLAKGFFDQFGISATGIDKYSNPDDLTAKLFADTEAILRKREEETGRLLYLRLFRNFYLQEIDNLWLEHLQDMDSLREGIGLRGYGQRDPKKEYQKEGFDLFLDLVQNVKANVVHKMFHFVLEREDEVEKLEEQRRKRSEAQQERLRMTHAAGDQAEGPEDETGAGASRRERRKAGVAALKQQPVRRDKPKLGRNDPCWCGSGKKYKQCHLRADQAQQGADLER
jgi:preprotein translocase subunit SecA